MFSLSIGEIIIIIAIVVIFIKPQDLPGFFRKIGKTIGELQRMKNELINMAENKAREHKDDDK